MVMNPFSRSLSLARRGIRNYFAKRPFCVSFEVTRRCNARCNHCHLGGPVDEKRALPQRYGELCQQIQPIIAQVSGGEPLLRKDLEQIIAALRIPNKAPYIVVTTNGVLLTKEKYHSLRQAGVDEISLSLDYPDERHDQFRNVPGLFHHIENLVNNLEPEYKKTITLSCVVQSDNFRELVKMAELSLEWNTNINFSTYTHLRTENTSYLISKRELEVLKEIIDRLLKFKKRYKNIFTSDFVLKRMIDFFHTSSISHCRAGERFLVVNPDGTLSPCGLIIKDYKSQKEIKEDFMKNNDCGYCYTSLRANAEKPARYLIMDSIEAISWSRKRFSLH